MSNRVVRRIRLIAFTLVISGQLSAGAAAAQEPPPGGSGLPYDEAKIARALEALTLPAVHRETSFVQQASPERPRRPEALLPLYASLAVVQGLDIHSTRRGIAAGRREINPVVEPLVENGAAHIAVKAAATSLVVVASEKLWRGKKRKTAVALAAVTNAALAAIVAHNYRAAR